VLVGYYHERRLYFAGKVRAGLTPHLRADIFRRLKPFTVERCPFVNLPNSTGRWGEGITQEDMAKLRWTKPAIVVEVRLWNGTKSGCYGTRRLSPNETINGPPMCD
jgi:ATP-dependent DNA ligase